MSRTETEKTAKDPLISIIIPVYNVEPYLEECLKSILLQSFSDYEAILIDDGSTDRSGMICDDYAEADDRFRVIHQENAKQGAARNAGLDHMRGKYVAMIDADDVLLSEEYLRVLLDALLENDADIAMCGVKYFRDGKSTPHVKNVSSRHNITSGREVFLEKGFRGQTYYRNYVYAKLYKKECFGDLRFPEKCFMEDVALIHQVIFPSPRIVFLHDQLYGYRMQNGSTTQSVSKLRLITDHIDALNRRLGFFEGERETELSDEVRNEITRLEEEKLEYLKHTKSRKNTAHSTTRHIILHIGTGKTGSSAIQKFLNTNHEVLSQQGTLYYRPKYRFLPWDKYSNADVILYSVYEKLGVDSDIIPIAKLADERLRLREFASSYDTVILTEEILWGRSFLYEGYWDAFKETIHEVFGNDIEISVIVYLRRQDVWALSKWKEEARAVHHTMAMQFAEYLQSLRDIRVMDYEYGIRKIEKAFQGDNIVVRGYDRSDPEWDIHNDFMSAAGIPWSRSYERETRDINTSISYDAAEAMALINSGACDESFGNGQIDRTEMRRVAGLFSKMFPEDREIYPLALEERIRILDEYREGNAYLADKYNGGKDLFTTLIEEYEHRPFDHKRATANADKIIKLYHLDDRTKNAIANSFIRADRA